MPGKSEEGKVMEEVMKEKLVNDILQLREELKERINRYKINLGAFLNPATSVIWLYNRRTLRKMTTKELRKIKRRLEKEVNNTTSKDYRLTEKVGALIKILEKIEKEGKGGVELAKDLKLLRSINSWTIGKGNAKKFEKEIERIIEKYKTEIIVYHL